MNFVLFFISSIASFLAYVSQRFLRSSALLSIRITNRRKFIKAMYIVLQLWWRFYSFVVTPSPLFLVSLSPLSSLTKPKSSGSWLKAQVTVSNSSCDIRSYGGSNDRSTLSWSEMNNFIPSNLPAGFFNNYIPSFSTIYCFFTVVGNIRSEMYCFWGSHSPARSSSPEHPRSPFANMFATM